MCSSTRPSWPPLKSTVLSNPWPLTGWRAGRARLVRAVAHLRRRGNGAAPDPPHYQPRKHRGTGNREHRNPCHRRRSVLAIGEWRPHRSRWGCCLAPDGAGPGEGILVTRLTRTRKRSSAALRAVDGALLTSHPMFSSCFAAVLRIVRACSTRSTADAAACPGKGVGAPKVAYFLPLLPVPLPLAGLTRFRQAQLRAAPPAGKTMTGERATAGPPQPTTPHPATKEHYTCQRKPALSSSRPRAAL